MDIIYASCFLEQEVIVEIKVGWTYSDVRVRQQSVGRQ